MKANISLEKDRIKLKGQGKKKLFHWILRKEHLGKNQMIQKIKSDNYTKSSKVTVIWSSLTTKVNSA